MSAYIVDKKHIDAIVAMTQDSEFYYHKVRNWKPEYIGFILIQANVRSVCHRYPDCKEDPGKSPGPNSKYWMEEYRWNSTTARPDPVEGLKLLDCFEYQSCEYPEWEESLACRLIEVLRRFLIRRVPGYAEAPWELYA